MNTMEETRKFLESIGQPGGDLYQLPDSDKTFDDGCQYRFEVPGIQSPSVMKALLEEIDRLGFYIHRVTQTKGIWTLSDADITAMVELAKQYLAKSNYKGEPIVFYYTDANFCALLKSYMDAVGINLDVQVVSSYPVKINDGKANWNIMFRNYSAGEAPSGMSATVFTRAWGSAAKDAALARVNGSISGSKENIQAWKDLCEIWVEEASVPYIGQTTLAWSHHKDLVAGYHGIDAYLWNWYWKNPAEHTEK